MKIIDLSLPLADKMPRYPSPYLPDVSLKAVATHQKEGRSVHLLTCGTHVSTHVDAPSHMVSGAKTLDQFEVGSFFGVAHMVRVHGRDKNSPIDAADFKAIQNIESCEMIVIDSAWADKTWGSKDYFTEGPYLTPAAATFLAGLPKLRLLGMDFPNVDSRENMIIGVPAPNHQTLMKKDILLLENLINLQKVDDVFFLSATPPKLTDGDGCPCRAFGISPVKDFIQYLELRSKK